MARLLWRTIGAPTLANGSANRATGGSEIRQLAARVKDLQGFELGRRAIVRSNVRGFKRRWLGEAGPSGAKRRGGTSRQESAAGGCLPQLDFLPDPPWLFPPLWRLLKADWPRENGLRKGRRGQGTVPVLPNIPAATDDREGSHFALLGSGRQPREWHNQS